MQNYRFNRPANTKNIWVVAKKMLSLKKNEEFAIQHSILYLFNLRLKDFIVFAVPNGTQIQNAITRAINILTGLKAGVSDLVLIYDGKTYFIEIKTKNGKQSAEQIQFQKDVENQGLDYVILRNLDDAEKFLKKIKGE